jgi:hypothetical protein
MCSNENPHGNACGRLTIAMHEMACPRRLNFGSECRWPRLRIETRPMGSAQPLMRPSLPGSPRGCLASRRVRSNRAVGRRASGGRTRARHRQERVRAWSTATVSHAIQQSRGRRHKLVVIGELSHFFWPTALNGLRRSVSGRALRSGRCPSSTTQEGPFEANDKPVLAHLAAP